MGENKLAGLMATMSKDAGLSQHYTNHSIRATAITLLDEAGIPGRDIMGLSGHRSENSLRSYSRRLPEKKKKRMSGVLADSLTENVPSTENLSFDENVLSTENVPSTENDQCAENVPSAISSLEVMSDTISAHVPTESTLSFNELFEATLENKGLSTPNIARQIPKSTNGKQFIRKSTGGQRFTMSTEQKPTEQPLVPQENWDTDISDNDLFNACASAGLPLSQNRMEQIMCHNCVVNITINNNGSK